MQGEDKVYNCAQEWSLEVKDIRDGTLKILDGAEEKETFGVLVNGTSSKTGKETWQFLSIVLGEHPTQGLKAESFLVSEVSGEGE